MPERALGGGSHFGEHITIDGYGGEPALLNDENVVLSALLDLSQQQGMTPLVPPVVVEAPDNQIKDPGGWTGFLVIAESHISIHTFPRRQFLSADLYTCRNGLSREDVLQFLTDRFGLAEVESTLIRRGLGYPTTNLCEAV